MTRDLIIGLDAGTSVIKSVAFTLDGTQVAMASRPNSYSRFGRGCVEQDMLRTWDDARQTLCDLAAVVPDLAERVAALAVTGQGDGCWLIDAAGEPIGDGLIWLDSRAAEMAAIFVAGPDHAAHYATTGTGLNACQQSIQLAWLQQHQPERLERATTALHCKDWLYFKLTGIRAVDPAEGIFTYGDFRSRSYAPDVSERLGIARHAGLMPEIVDGALTHHRLTDAAATATGLPTGLPVVLGYVDVVCSAIGGGLYDVGGEVGCSILGSTGMHMRMSVGADAVALNPACSGYTMALPGPDLYAQIQSNMAGTVNIDWAVEMARQACAMAGIDASRQALLAGVDAHVAAATPGSALYHPYILQAGERGPFMNAEARAQFVGLSTNTTFAGLVRAIYEGLGLAARDCYSVMGQIPGEIRVTGGAARSASLLQIFADILGASVRRVMREETGAAGAAMIGAIGLGHYASLAACAEQWVTPTLGPSINPDPGCRVLYDKLFPIYRSVREAMPPVWAALADAREATQ
ncbi:carbohydrate kinase [Bradyrhizobium sp. 38]|uniref:FGGY-family carbohydrate kinase n=1 Tax=unclassified Bradyrhizobium TaxID=2631580 RepID=UPI001FFA3B26|nr:MULTISPECIES: FGGY-family carbohydrate kinase [unclassified Bradyrhizobium]MCK1337953.1 carbohydrate kinase [Bradyrhizobium sp. 38]MCK1780407.1 carbohydrate kinase [Bradyrhizobium sp. 132]